VAADPLVLCIKPAALSDTPKGHLSLQTTKEGKMANSVYKVIQLVGSSPNSWEEAAKNAVETAGKSLRDLRVAEVEKLDMKVENGKVTAFRTRVNLSFKYGGE
jgi:flavin-binding protein dodecin